MGELHIRPARLSGPDNELAAIVQLQTEALGEGPTRTREFFEWKHLDNPFGPSFVLVAEHDDRLVALRAMMRWRFDGRRRGVRAVRAVDTATHPTHRRQGLFKRLTMQLVESLGAEGIDMVFNTPNEQSRPGYLKMGWADVGRPTIFVRVGGRFLPRRTPALGTHGQGMRLAHEARLHTPRDARYLRWRYSEAAGLDYRVHCRDGAAVYSRVRQRGGRDELMITDVIVPERSGIPAAASLLRKVVGGTRTDYAIAMAAARTREAAVLLGAGFIPLSGRGPRLVTRRIPGQPTVEQASRLSGWRLQVGDLELF